MITNPYEILGVSEGASMDEIRRAYRKKAKENHPDLHPDDPRATERMQRINAAYDMLSNPDKYRASQRTYPGGGNQSANAGRRYGTGNYGQYGTYGSNPYGQYGADPFGGYRWQYTWSSGADAGNPGQNARSGETRRSSAIVRPFRSILRVAGGLLMFRFLLTLLRFGLFGFFF
ncbi:MAG: DnaJ domain-containing protein [Clostridia bacterium]|nr:DnaJ domain-containing protein [Clostridia bacterium]